MSIPTSVIGTTLSQLKPSREVNALNIRHRTKCPPSDRLRRVTFDWTSYGNIVEFERDAEKLAEARIEKRMLLIVPQRAGELFARPGCHFACGRQHVAIDVDHRQSLPPLSSAPSVLHGHFADLFDANLLLISECAITPGRRALLLDLDLARKDGASPRVIAASARIRDEKAVGNRLTFRAEGIAESEGVILILAPRKPAAVRIAGALASEDAVHFENGTLHVHLHNSPGGIAIEADFSR